MDYVVLLFRIVTIMLTLLIMTLIMGRRQVGELPVLDFIIAITIGSVAGADIADFSIPHLPTVVAIILLGSLQVIFTKLILKKRKAGKFFTFEPVIVIQKGKIVKKNLQKIGFSLDNLLFKLRQQGIQSPEEIDYGIIEPNGGLSLIKNPEHRPPTAGEMGIKIPGENLILPVIADGKVFPQVLRSHNLDVSELQEKLAAKGIRSFKEVFFASLDKNQNLYLIPQNEDITTPPLRL